MKRTLLAAALAVAVHGGLLMVTFPEPVVRPPAISEFKLLSLSLVAPKSAPARKPEPPNLVNPVKPLPEMPRPEVTKPEVTKVEKPKPAPRLPPPAPVETVRPIKKKKMKKKKVSEKRIVPGKQIPVDTPAPEERLVKKTDKPATPAEKPLPAPESSPDEAQEGPAAPEKASASQVVREARPLYLKNPPPRYPMIARKRHYQGVVELEVLVAANGSVADIRLFKSSGYAVLDKAALKSVGNWAFAPGRRGDRPIRMWVKCPVRFRLE